MWAVCVCLTGESAAAAADYTEVPLDSLDISAADSLSLSPHAGVWPSHAGNSGHMIPQKSSDFCQINLICVCVDGSDAETERLEELPLCSCRMEAPRVDGFSARSNRTCMAIESINGEVSPASARVPHWGVYITEAALTRPVLCVFQLVGCTSVIVKGETMRPSSRVSLMVLCETHRSHMVKHHCCPGCGYFCLSVSVSEHASRLTGDTYYLLALMLHVAI